MISFENDYSEGACPEILRRLQETNLEQTSGYGTDPYCKSAGEKIRSACGRPDAQVYFLSGGTQTNQIVIDSLLTQYEGVVACESGHVATHEAGAIEYSGHKVLTLPEHDGRIDAQELRRFLEDFHADGNHEHMVFPGMVYLSHPTEMGTLYTREELRAISRVTREFGIPLYLDGARLGYGLVSPGTDVDLPEIAQCCDVFYIGGTKVGALFGEAVVFTGSSLPSHFITRMKMHGGLLAKGRILGLQFDTLFTDGLYERISRHAIGQAMRLREGLLRRKCRLLVDSPTNQQFLVLSNPALEQLQKKVRMSFWSKVDESHTAVRLATSWATLPENVDAFFAALDEVLDSMPG